MSRASIDFDRARATFSKARFEVTDRCGRSIAAAAAAARSLLLDSDSRLRLSVVVAFPQGGAQVIERVDAPRVADAAGVEGARRSLVPVGSRRISEINRFFSRRARSVADLRPSFFAREQGVRASRSARSAPWRCRERWKPPGGRCGSGSGDETNGGSIEAEGGWKKVAGTGQLKGDVIKC